MDKGVPLMVVERLSGVNNILAAIELEVIKLTTLVNVDSRLNIQSHQVPVIAETLYDAFKRESIEDFKLCFARGAAGFYDERGIFRLDGAVLTAWMQKYLDEKYQLVENAFVNEKREEKDSAVDYTKVHERIERDRKREEEKQQGRYAEVHKEAEYIKYKATTNPRTKFICDGIEVLAKDEHYARQAFKQYFKREPTTIERPSVENPETRAEN